MDLTLIELVSLQEEEMRQTHTEGGPREDTGRWWPSPRIKSAVLSHPVCGTFLWKPKQINTFVMISQV